MNIEFQKTLNGKTLGDMLKSAKIVEMQAGNKEVVITTKKGEEFFVYAGMHDAVANVRNLRKSVLMENNNFQLLKELLEKRDV